MSFGALFRSFERNQRGLTSKAANFKTDPESRRRSRALRMGRAQEPGIATPVGQQQQGAIGGERQVGAAMGQGADFAPGRKMPEFDPTIPALRGQRAAIRGRRRGR